MHMPVKKRWIKQARDGDVESFERVMTYWENPIYTLLSAWLDTPEQANGCLGSVFLQAYQAFPAYSERESLAVWLFRIAVQVCGDPSVHTSTMEEGIEDTPSQSEWEYLRRLPVLYQKSLLLRECAGLTYEEIAAVYRTEPMAVRLQISEGRKKIAEDMKRESGCTNPWSDSVSSEHDGELTEKIRKQQLASHLKSCPACRDYQAFLKQLTAHVSQGKLVSEDLHENAMEVVMEDIRQRTVQYTGPKHHVPVFTLIGAAAAVVILVLSGSLGDWAIFNKSSTNGLAAPTVAESSSEPEKTNQKPVDQTDAHFIEGSKQDSSYIETDDLLDIPSNVIQGKSYAYYFLAVGDGDIPQIKGTLLAAEDHAVYMEVSRDTQILEKIDTQLHQSDYQVYQPSDERINISDRSQKALLVICQTEDTDK
jgi:RNA polymerase sigma-70 factor (ECF subfamily)